MNLKIQSVSFESDGLVVSYTDASNDIRVGGRVQIAHQVFLSIEHPDYADDYDLLQRQATKALRSALEDFADSDPFTPSEEDDVAEGMGADD